MSTPAYEDRHDARLALRAAGLLRTFNDAGVLEAADVHVAQRLARLGAEDDDRVLLAGALAVRGVRLGSVCVDLAGVRDIVAADDTPAVDVDTLPWPEPQAWLAACAASPLVRAAGDGRGQPLRLVGGLVYLDRYWRQEQVVREELDARAAPIEGVDPARLRALLAELFDEAAPDRQRLAAATAALRSLTVVAGGPGTGKTTSVAQILDLLRRLHDPTPRVALAAPTGKAAARMAEAVRAEAGRRSLDVGAVDATTIHRLLERRPGSRSRFRHDRNDRLPYDVVVVDETSMVSLTMMSRLVEAVRPQARLVLVGDPEQLASVEAGAVLADLVARPVPASAQAPPALDEVAGADLVGIDDRERRGGVVRLTTNHRYGEEIRTLAEQIQRVEVDADGVLGLLRSGRSTVRYVETPADGTLTRADLEPLRADVVQAARTVAELAVADRATEALAAVDRHRLLVAHRRGPHGVQRWNEQVELWRVDALGRQPRPGEWYPGQPLLVTENDYDVELFNGDTGVVLDAGTRGLVAAFARGDEPVLISPSRLAAVQTAYAMTVHKAQGSQFDAVTLLLPTPQSRVLTRELVYTAVTRATTSVRVIGSAEAVRRAVRRAVARASGLRHPG